MAGPKAGDDAASTTIARFVACHSRSARERKARNRSTAGGFNPEEALVDGYAGGRRKRRALP